MTPIDWLDWHRAYDDPTSPLHRRLLVVQDHIRAALDAAPPGPIRVISVCAGQAVDLLGAMDGHARARDVRARLVELDPRNAAIARSRAPAGVEVLAGDASRLDAYAGAVPADVVLICGVLGRISNHDLANTMRLLPQLTAHGGTVIWTRHRRPPDRTPRLRRLLARAGFEETAVDVPAGEIFTVGSHRHAGMPPPLDPHGRLFTAYRS